ncbi:MAG: hypothetical protein ACRDPY_43740, partial [Streptosporangiaceae bacterium]
MATRTRVYDSWALLVMHFTVAGRRGPTRREEITMTENKAQKSAIRQRMAATGEPYSVARREVEREYYPATGAAPAAMEPPEAAPSATEATGAQPAGAQPAGAQPAGAQPAGAQPAGAQPTAAEPTGTQPPAANRAAAHRDEDERTRRIVDEDADADA